MELKTKRLLLRPWRESDAEELYRYAKNPAVGPIAGWPPHTNVENSREIIRTILSAPETYAVVLRETELPVGSAGLLLGGASNLSLPSDEGELGYWVGVPYWGQGLIPEVVKELVRYGFEELGLSRIWCASFDGNERSRRVQMRCGFRYHHTEYGVKGIRPNETRTLHVSCLSRAQYLGSRDGEDRGGGKNEHPAF